jgi:hypothetical protein
MGKIRCVYKIWPDILKELKDLYVIVVIIIVVVVVVVVIIIIHHHPSSSPSAAALTRQPSMGPGLPRICLPIFSIRCHTHPVSYAKNSDVLPHTFFQSQSWSSHFHSSFWFGINTFLIILFSIARIRC